METMTKELARIDDSPGGQPHVPVFCGVCLETLEPGFDALMLVTRKGTQLRLVHDSCWKAL